MCCPSQGKVTSVIGQSCGMVCHGAQGVIMLTPSQVRTSLKRARMIAASGDYDEDVVRRLLLGLEDELKEVSLEPVFAEALQEMETFSR